MTNPFATAPAPAAPAPAAPPAALPVPTPAAPLPGPAADAFGGVDPFANSDPAPQIDRPRLREMYGRLVIIVPFKVEQVQRTYNGQTKLEDRMTADVIVLDGGPMPWGGKPEGTPPIPHDRTAEIPYRVEKMFISSVGLISQCSRALADRAAGKPGMVIGRLRTGEAKPNQSAPWLLDAATDADKGVGRAWLASNDPFTSTG